MASRRRYWATQRRASHALLDIADGGVLSGRRRLAVTLRLLRRAASSARRPELRAAWRVLFQVQLKRSTEKRRRPVADACSCRG